MTELTLNNYLGFSRRYDYPSKEHKIYLPANLHISARLIRFIVISNIRCRRGEGGQNSGVIGEVVVSIRVIYMYLIDGKQGLSL